MGDIFFPWGKKDVYFVYEWNEKNNFFSIKKNFLDKSEMNVNHMVWTHFIFKQRDAEKYQWKGIKIELVFFFLVFLVFYRKFGFNKKIEIT